MKKVFWFAILLVLLAVSAANIACSGCMGPPKVLPIEEIKTNETAFLVPLEGASKGDQQKFMSVEFLKTAKVATKRITIPVTERSLGRMWWSYEWLPTIRVVKVDRTPVTREWTSDETTGTTKKNEAITVESLDSIGFSIGINLTASVTEEDAATFLYYYAGKPLSEVVDQNVRGFVQSDLSGQFGQKAMEDCKKEKKAIFDELLTAVRGEFKKKGVTIDNLGYAEGLMYDNAAIQKAIDERIVAEMDVQTAKQRTLEQKETNERLESEATSKAKQAIEFAKAGAAQTAKTQLDIDLIKAQAMATFAEKWNGQMPSSIMPQGSQMMFGLDTPAKK